ncbi:HupE/UreJ family protein [Reyranella sp.]|uniref:HupE/UreJ family protein n=1 Tax=Reyranella sp. TaxID=1929291 RepID=UPI003D12A326
MRRGWRGLACALLPFALLFHWVGLAAAHTGGTTGFARITVEGETVRYSLTLDVEALSKAQNGPLAADQDTLASIVARHVEISADGTPCAALPGTVQPAQPGRPIVVVVIHYACAAAVGTLTLRDGLSAVFGRDHHTLASIEGPAGTEQFLLDPNRPEVRVAISGPPAGASAAELAPESAYGFFRLGIEHIVTGFDHILFLFALMLRGGRIGSLLAIVTAFTVGHSLTLGLSVLGIVRLPAEIIEPLIAASIAYVACENIFLQRAPSRRWLVSLLFGLVHGFGFAGALLELELPRDGLFSSLLFFNLGVETGQAMIVALLFPALVLLSRFAWEKRAVTVISAVVLVAAVGLLTERTFLP